MELEIEIREIRKKDYKKAIQFAITGMHFNLYLDSRFLLNIYGRYFWYDELNCATQVLAAYEGDELAGVLLANMNDEKKKYRTVGKIMFTKMFDFIQNVFYKGGVGVYEEANNEMFEEYKKDNAPDGQIVFLAANPAGTVKGVGSRLLAELEDRERGRQVYLYTDDACTYQFYEHRGFKRAGEKDIIMQLGSKKVPLKCMLYSKKIK